MSSNDYLLRIYGNERRQDDYRRADARRAARQAEAARNKPVPVQPAVEISSGQEAEEDGWLSLDSSQYGVSTFSEPAVE